MEEFSGPVLSVKGDKGKLELESKKDITGTVY